MGNVYLATPTLQNLMHYAPNGSIRFSSNATSTVLLSTIYAAPSHQEKIKTYVVPFKWSDSLDSCRGDASHARQTQTVIVYHHLPRPTFVRATRYKFDQEGLPEPNQNTFLDISLQ
jgi:hypothetical protein